MQIQGGSLKLYLHVVGLYTADKKGVASEMCSRAHVSDLVHFH